MIEDVEHFQAEIQRCRLSEFGVFLEACVPVDRSRPAEAVLLRAARDTANFIAELLGVPESWVYANAAQIPGVIRLGRYVRFRPVAVRQFITGSEVVQ